MDKKKTGLAIIIIIVLVIVLGSCFMIFGGQDRRDKQDKAQSVTPTDLVVESGIPSTTEPSEEIEYIREEELTNIVTDAAERRNEILNEIADKEYLGVPENFQKVLRQYEQLLWVTINMDWDSAWDELYSGKWEYVDNYLYGDGRDDNIYYCLADISGDGFPEMILGKKSSYHEEWYPYVIYFDNGEEAQMGCQGGGHAYMYFYSNGVIEISGAGYNIFHGFQQDEQEWRCIAGIEFDLDAEGKEVIYLNNIDSETWDPSLREEISEEDYQHLMEQYRATPIDFEWTVLWQEVG